MGTEVRTRKTGFAMVLGLMAALFGSRAEADTRAGIEAYRRGDYARALAELERGAKRGDAQAFYNLGVLYAEGRAVPADRAKAVAMYKRGAERGSVLAAYNLAQAYRKGEGTPVDFAQAARWYEFAAKRGDYRAGNELGILYVEGKGVKADMVEGFAWIYTGTHMDIMDEKAMMNAMQLARQMTREQLNAAQDRGRRYYERYIKPHPEVVRTLLRQ